jgi:hypothetical protein
MLRTKRVLSVASVSLSRDLADLSWSTGLGAFFSFYSDESCGFDDGLDFFGSCVFVSSLVSLTAPPASDLPVINFVRA